ncbi:Tetratricopeptide repeat protein 30A [Coelomomyces lativittatus]|nr:Tetratricopeptide repeat protein 30A [Coelomomyces lativittatus]KAJ1518124.1 Tetratricopeptide repeat protein 30A [Coelomomyces lativittatus]KAJ1518514.1 Tetratricopeptide repeat protein 30A [Coelomomyces lativittatus]
MAQVYYKPTDSMTSAPLSISQIPLGHYTSLMYGLLREHRYEEMVPLLNEQLMHHPNARPALSLLGLCYFQLQDWGNAIGCYEILVKDYPEVPNYAIYYAYCLYKAGQYNAAHTATLSIQNPKYQDKIRKIQAAIKFELDDLSGCRLLIDQCAPDDPDTLFNQACLLYKQSHYAEAQTKFQEVLKRQGYQAEVTYQVALCAYQLKDYATSIKYVADLIDHGIRDYPDLNIGVSAHDILSVGNSKALHQSFLVEAFNLKAAIEYTLKNTTAAKEAFQDMPPRLEEELDPVTLHNQALVHMDMDPTSGFEKLIFLLQQSPCPPETFGNLLLLYLKFEYYDAAADLLAENAGLAREVLSRYLYEFLSAILLKSVSVEDSFKKLEELGQRHLDQLRHLSKQVQEARTARDEEKAKKYVIEYDQRLERYLPILMSQAKLYWDQQRYSVVEKIFRKSVEVCSDQEAWKLNVAHVLFMQENKYKEALAFYEPLVIHYDASHRLLEVTAIVLANLCVSYIMTSQNEEAETWMRKIEKEEERIAFEDPHRPCFHLCIVNLVIGTLYCAKGNFEFGISRVMKSMEPMHRKLGTDTWYYASRCFCALFETLAKQMIVLKDDVYHEVLEFLDACDVHGCDIPAVSDPMGMANLDPTQNSVSYEARLLKSLYLRLYD